MEDKREKGRAFTNGLLVFTIIIYLFLLLQIIVFKTLASPLDLFTGNHPFMRSVNLIPFKGMWDDELTAASNRTSLFGNVILFVPLGLLLETFAPQGKRGAARSLAIIAAASLLFEGIQYTFAIGVTDINDLILNTLGGLAGILIYRILLRAADRNKARTVIAVAGGLVGVAMVLLYVMLLLANA
ncbi:VanZ family protein [Paenibacillus sp. NPDC058071]|uniref:VanZ family protein n=1 Tax=Paenibacillus sp. NPDC058071 TaxID=3346326 RepID=UPI0036D97373